MSTTDLIYFRKLYNDSIVPVRATPCAAAFDLYAYEDTIITGGAGNIMVSTGVAVQLPRGTYGRIAMRSGLAAREHLSVSAGVIDRDYTGEIKVLVFCSKVLDTTPTNKGLLLPHTYSTKERAVCAADCRKNKRGCGSADHYNAPDRTIHTRWIWVDRVILNYNGNLPRVGLGSGEVIFCNLFVASRLLY